MMKPFDFIAFRLALFLALGIVLGNVFEIQLLLSGSLAGIGLCILGFAAFKSPYRTYLFGGSALFVVLTSGMLLASLATQPNRSNHYTQYDFKGVQLWHLKIREIGNTTDYGQAYETKVISMGEQPVMGKIRLCIKHTSRTSTEPFKIDDEILVWGNPSKLAAVLNPYQWDYARYLRNQNIYHQLVVQPQQVYELGRSRATLKGWSQGIRNNVIYRLQQANFGNKELGIIKALLLGQRRDIASETLSQYRRAGAVHILAISGLHVGILLMILRALFYPLTILPGGRVISLCLSVLILWVYALIAGFSPSVIRAVAMFSFLAYSLFLNRLSHGYNSLALSMFFLLVLIDPNLIFQVGFQMSYAAVLAILWVYPVFLRLWNPRFWILKRVWQLLAVSLSAQIGVLPISLYYFHQFPALFIISSLVIIPFLGFILGGGVIIMALSLLETLPVFIAELYNQLIFHMNGFVGWLARQDAFFFKDLSFDGFELVLGYTLLFTLVKWLKKPAGLAARNILIALVLFQGYGTYEGYMTRNTERILILHQYGNSVLLHQKGQKLDVYGANAKSKVTLIKDFRVGARIEKVAYLTLRKNYAIQGKCITRLDSTATDLPEESNGILWLTYSPRINLDRYINYCDPKMIIADGSNYPNLVRKWKQTATEKNIPFHFTGESGSLLFDL